MGCCCSHCVRSTRTWTGLCSNSHYRGHCDHHNEAAPLADKAQYCRQGWWRRLKERTTLHSADRTLHKVSAESVSCAKTHTGVSRVSENWAHSHCGFVRGRAGRSLMKTVAIVWMSDELWASASAGGVPNFRSHLSRQRCRDAGVEPASVGSGQARRQAARPVVPTFRSSGGGPTMKASVKRTCASWSGCSSGAPGSAASDPPGFLPSTCTATLFE